jgi:hypothetical protein
LLSYSINYGFSCTVCFKIYISLYFSSFKHKFQAATNKRDRSLRPQTSAAENLYDLIFKKVSFTDLLTFSYSFAAGTFAHDKNTSLLKKNNVLRQIFSAVLAETNKFFRWRH